MKSIRVISGIVALLLMSLSSQVSAVAGDGLVRDVRLWTAPDHSRLVFDLNQKIEYKVFPLHNPERIVIDMERTQLKANLNSLQLPDPVVQSIRHGKPTSGTLRVVMDVKERVQPRTFLLKPMQGKPYRLVVDLSRPEQAKQAAMRSGESRAKKGLVIAIDAGHGGEDPGAIGPRKLYEKTVTLAVAKELAKIVDATPGMNAVLIRNGDYFVPLKKRVYLARKAKADMMISIHADAVRQRNVEGSSVYTLSERGATQDRAARALAAKENAADEVGGVEFDTVDDPMVTQILGDMFRRDSLNSSQILAESIIGKLKHAGPVKYSAPKRARFFVLGAMEIPSVLVELDYISNPAREKKLKSRDHQKKLASALFNASVSFFQKMGRLKSTPDQAMLPADSATALQYAVSEQGL
ncbi:N-acetylmuramoyl-L-alanine amidase [Mariprofundus ferrinatatus]|uniref:N-acetylmuramoyl-L-alanine amidase n=1 Tax=Mariprofundus ferrinatatus TaxID=1921087 RepID=A0A2K8L2Y4_9PROT|nr:N-acetylmuramoyl-L-alanine amidase [Mariprofundus ferrinatatus]ATX81462.1 N-acetylmuramoyl-L-alanine amidase [Mariprofundus ferrinatatus]